MRPESNWIDEIAPLSRQTIIAIAYHNRNAISVPQNVSERRHPMSVFTSSKEVEKKDMLIPFVQCACRRLEWNREAYKSVTSRLPRRGPPRKRAGPRHARRADRAVNGGAPQAARGSGPPRERLSVRVGLCLFVPAAVLGSGKEK